MRAMLRIGLLSVLAIMPFAAHATLIHVSYVGSVISEGTVSGGGGGGITTVETGTSGPVNGNFTIDTDALIPIDCTGFADLCAISTDFATSLFGLALDSAFAGVLELAYTGSSFFFGLGGVIGDGIGDYILSELGTHGHVWLDGDTPVDWEGGGILVYLTGSEEEFSGAYQLFSLNEVHMSVDEPASYGILLIGLAGLFFARRRLRG